MTKDKSIRRKSMANTTFSSYHCGSNTPPLNTPPPFKHCFSKHNCCHSMVCWGFFNQRSMNFCTRKTLVTLSTWNQVAEVRDCVKPCPITSILNQIISITGMSSRGCITTKILDQKATTELLLLVMSESEKGLITNRKSSSPSVWTDWI